MADLLITDRAVRDHLRSEVLRPRYIERTIALAVDAIQREAGDRSQLRRLEKQMANLDRELANLAETAARGGAVPAVLTLLAQRDEQRRAAAAALGAAQRALGVPVLSMRAIQTRLRGMLGDWHALLKANVKEARGVLDCVLADRIRFTPDHAQRRYTLTLPIGLQGAVTAVLPEIGAGLQEMMASPTGFEPVF